MVCHAELYAPDKKILKKQSRYAKEKRKTFLFLLKNTITRKY